MAPNHEDVIGFFCRYIIIYLRIYKKDQIEFSQQRGWFFIWIQQKMTTEISGDLYLFNTYSIKGYIMLFSVFILKGNSNPTIK